MSSPSDSPSGQVLGRPARGALLGDRRGLSVTGAVVLVLLLGGAGAAYDIVLGSGLGLGFAVGFIAGCALAALLVRREALMAAVVLPPLVYVVLAVAGNAADGAGAASGFLSDQALALLDAVVLGAPVLVGGTLAAAVLAGLRALVGRSR